MSSEIPDNPSVKSKPKKKSIIERELETSLTEKFTVPVLIDDKSSTSRYGRARRSKCDADFCDSSKAVVNVLKSPKTNEKTSNQSTPPAFKMHASNSPSKKETPQKSQKLSLESQIENIYNENQMLSRFSSEKNDKSTSVKKSKIYVRKDLIQRKEKEETITLIKNMFSPSPSPKQSNHYLGSSSEKRNYNKPQNGHVDMSSVVKTLDFGTSKKRKHKEGANKVETSKNELFEIEAKCAYQVGDVAWARMGTFPFWPCIVTRDPESGIFVKKKLFGRIERDIINVTFFNDNGRRGWVVENMLRSFKGKAEFIETRETFTAEDKKKDPKLYASFFVSEKKQQLWDTAIDEADSLLKEPKRFRIDLLNEMILKARAEKFGSKKSGKITRTDSDVSLSESLYDSLFSEEDIKDDSLNRCAKNSRNKSFDVSDVVTACLDSMAAKTGITKINKQSHMDIWLQKAKSKTPEKNQIIQSVQKMSETKRGSAQKTQPSRSRSSRTSKRKSGGKLMNDNVIDLDIYEPIGNDHSVMNVDDFVIEYVQENGETGSQFGIIAKIESLSNQTFEDAAPENQINLETVAVTEQIIESQSEQLEDQQTVNVETSHVNYESEYSLKKNYHTNDLTSESSESNSSGEKNMLNSIENPFSTDSEQLPNKNQTEINNDVKRNVTIASTIPDSIGKNGTTHKIITKANIDCETICNDIEMEDIQEKEIIYEKEKQSVKSKAVNDENTNVYEQNYSAINQDVEIVDISEKVTLMISDNGLGILKQNTKEISKATLDLVNEVENTRIKTKPTISPEISKETKKDKDNSKIRSHINELSVTTDDSVSLQNTINDPEFLKYLELRQDSVIDEHPKLCYDEIVQYLHKTWLYTDKSQPDTKKIDKSNHVDSVKGLKTKAKGKKKQAQLENYMKDSTEIQKIECKVSENTDNQINGDIVHEPESPTNLNNSLEEKSVQNREKTVQKEVTTRKRLSLRRTAKDINRSNDETNSLNKPEGKSEKTDNTVNKLVMPDKSNRKGHASLNHEKVKSNDNIISLIDVADGQSNKNNTNQDPIKTVTKSKNNESTEFESMNISIEKEIGTGKSKNKICHKKIVNHLDTNPLQEPERTNEIGPEQILKQARSKADSVKIDVLDTVISVLDNRENSNSISKIDVAKPIPVKKSENASTIDLKVSLKADSVKLNITDSEISILDTKYTSKSEGKIENVQKVTVTDESSETNVRDLIDSAKTDSVKINITDMEISISDGNVRSVTESPFESLKQDYGTRESSPCKEDEIDSESINSGNSEVPLSKLSRKIHEDDLETVSLNSNNSSSSRTSKKNIKKALSDNIIETALHNAEFVKYLELRQDQILDENPELTQNEVIKYLYKTWLYEEESKSDVKKSDELESSNIVKGLNGEERAVKSKRRVNKLYNNVRLESRSISSDENEGTSKRSLRSRTNSPLEMIVRSRTGSPCDFPTKEKVAKVVLTKFTEDLIPQINKIHNEAGKNSLNSTPDIQINNNIDPEVASIDSENSDIPLIQHKLHQEKLVAKQEATKQIVVENTETIDSSVPLTEDSEVERSAIKTDANFDSESVKSDQSISLKRTKRNKEPTKPLEDPEFVKYLELRQDSVMDEHPELCYDEIVQYLHKTWLYEESSKSETKKNDELEQLNLVKGLNNEPISKKVKKRVNLKKYVSDNSDSEDDIETLEESSKSEDRRDELKQINLDKNLSNEMKPQHKRGKKSVKSKQFISDESDSNSEEDIVKEKPKRKIAPTSYNEEYDVEDDIQYFEIFNRKPKISYEKKPTNSADATDFTKIMLPKVEKEQFTDNSDIIIPINNKVQEGKFFDKAEIYFQNLTKPKPNLFKGIPREKLCEICEKPSSLVKCKGCHGTFHPECVKKETEIVDVATPTRGRKKKKKPRGRKPKSANDSLESGSHSDEKYQGVNYSDDNLNMSIEEMEPIVADADSFEAQAAAKMKELLESQSNPYSLSANFQIDWPTKKSERTEIIELKLPEKIEETIDYSDFKCNNCQKTETPICFVCKSPVSPKSFVEYRQKCLQMHCHKYYHLECLDHWPQTQFSSGEMVKSKNNQTHEAFTCPRHVCHTCVSDDPRGCKSRFSADKLARCVRCPATYHTFTKCLPAGSQILTGSHIICPRHYEHRPGKVPCHVNTGWCFICALGGILICCEYCPTSFHADCLNISPPEGGYMCEDCETGRLPLYGEMVWVKLGQYRWWPGLILHPGEVPANIMAVKHSPGEFVVRFFGQYDHYWVNRGRVFPFQEGDSGKISSQKSKIDAAFTMAVEHAQRACQILKNANLNQAESDDIASSLLPPHYVKLKVNKPCGSLVGRRVELEESSLTQCECDPNDEDPCGPSAHCLNRMLLTECGPTCRAGDRCQNRAFEKRQYPKLTPYRTPYRGWGLKTLEDIKMGQFVIEYVGELIDEEEFRRRMNRMHDVRDENFYFLTLDKERMIDAGPKGNLARFMNHCCEPNCETQKWTVLGDVRVGLFALKDIPAGSEVTFNYNLQCAGIEKKRCLCGARRCSGYIGAKPKQDESQPKKPKRVYRKRKPEESPTVTKTKTPKPRTTSRSKPRELTEIEKDLLIIKNATNGLSSDSEASGRLSSFDMESDKNQKLKRKRVSFSSESEVILLNGDLKPPNVKRCKIESDKVNDVGD